MPLEDRDAGTVWVAECPMGDQGLVRPLLTEGGTVVLLCDSGGEVWLTPEDVGVTPPIVPGPPSWAVTPGVHISPGTTRWAGREEMPWVVPSPRTESPRPENTAREHPTRERMFAELHWPSPSPVDRDEVEDAVADVLDGLGEVTGAGVGDVGSNLDLELDDETPRDEVLGLIRRALAALGLQSARIRFEDEPGWHSLAGPPSESAGSDDG